MNACDRQPSAAPNRPPAQPIAISITSAPKRTPRADPSPPCVPPGPPPFTAHETHKAPKAGEPPLFAAARTGDHETLKRLLTASPSLEAPFDIALDPDAMEAIATALMVALGSGDGATPETARTLLDHGANPNANLNCGTPFTFAARGLGWGYKPGGDAQRLALIIERGGTPPTDESTRAEIMCAAAKVGDAARLRILLDLGFPPNPVWDPEEAQREHEKALASTRELMNSMRERMNEALRPIMQETGIDQANTNLDDALDELDPQVRGPWYHDIPLFQAAISGSAEAVQLLLRRGANPNQLDSDAQTALFYAWSPPIARLLLDAGSDPTITSTSGVNAVVGLFEAHKKAGGHVPTGCLVESSLIIAAAIPNFDPISFPKWPDSKLAFAANNRLEGAVEALLRLGAPPSPPKGKRSALHQLCWHGSYEDPAENRAAVRIVELLVNAGAPIEGRDEDGLTPLHHAVSGDWGNEHTTRALLELGASADSKDPQGVTPLMLAADAGELACAVALLEHGADPTFQDTMGKSAIDRALDNLDGVRETTSNPELTKALQDAIGADYDQAESAAQDEKRLRDAEVLVATLRAVIRREISAKPAAPEKAP